MPPEDHLFQRFRSTGDAGALAELFDRTAGELFRVAVHLCRARQEAEDLVQETFLQAIEFRDRYRDDLKVLPWMCGILANLARRRRSASARDRSTHLSAAEGVAAASDTVEEVERRELHTTLQSTIRGLPDPYREVLRLHLLEGRASKAIAISRRCPSSTVRNQLMRGMDLLRRSLPTGLVGGAVAGVLSTSARASVRARVLDHARHTTTPNCAGSDPTFGNSITVKTGALAMKNVVLMGIAAITLLLLGVQFETASLEVRRPASSPTSEIADDPVTGAISIGQSGLPERVSLASADARSAGALTVRARFQRNGNPARALGVYLRRLDGPADLGRELQTDDSGVVRFFGLAGGRYLLQPDRCDGREVDVADGESREVVFEIPQGVTAQGVVVDSDGQPVAGAGVFAVRVQHHAYRQQLSTTREDGSFQVEEVTSGTMLRAFAEGFAPSPVSRRATVAEDQRLVLRLGPPGASLHGRVVGPARNPVPYAVVVVASAPEQDEVASALPRSSVVVRADADGRFQADSVPAGDLLLLAREPREGFEGLAIAQVKRMPGDSEEVVLQLRPGAEIRGVVTDDDGRGYEGLGVRVEWEGDPVLGRLARDVGAFVTDRTAITGVDGTFRIAGLPPGRHDVMVGAVVQKDLRLSTDDVVLRSRLQLAEGEVGVFKKYLSRRRSMTVRVVDRQDRPLSGYGVHAARRAGQATERRLAMDSTDNDGRVVLTVEGEITVISVHAPLDGAPDSIPAQVFVGRWEGDEALVRLDAEPRASINGLVRDSSGSILSRARVELRLPDWNPRRALRTVDSNEDGTFLFSALPAGIYRLEVRHPDHPRVLQGPYELRQAESRELGAVVLPDAGRIAVSVRGDAVDPRVEVWPTDSGSGGGRSSRQEDGTFLSPPLAAGPHHVILRSGNSAPVWQEVEVHPGLQQLELLAMSAETRRLDLYLPGPAREDEVRIELWLGTSEDPSILAENGRLLSREDVRAVFLDSTRTVMRVEIPMHPGRYGLGLRVRGYPRLHTEWNIPADRGDQPFRIDFPR